MEFETNKISAPLTCEKCGANIKTHGQRKVGYAVVSKVTIYECGSLYIIGTEGGSLKGKCDTKTPKGRS